MATGLYRTFKSNYVPYFPDGNGRDRYIAYNNAGFFKNYPGSQKDSYLNNKNGCFFGTKIVTHVKSPSVKTPNFHYYADGNGRDKYILVNGGGLFTQSKPLISYKLTDFLRNDDDNLSPKKKIRTYLSRDEIKYNNLLKENERNVIKRLYLNERKKFMKRPKINFKSFFSVDQLNNDSRENLVNNTKTFLTNNKNDSKEKENSTQFLTHRNIIHRNRFFNDQPNHSESNEKKVKIKPKIIIDAKINNKVSEFSKEVLHPEKQEEDYSNYVNSNNFLTDIEKLKNYQFRLKSLNNRKLKGFRIKNSLSTGK
jgi:hypothetical protein